MKLSAPHVWIPIFPNDCLICGSTTTYTLVSISGHMSRCQLSYSIQCSQAVCQDALLFPWNRLLGLWGMHVCFDVVRNGSPKALTSHTCGSSGQMSFFPHCWLLLFLTTKHNALFLIFLDFNWDGFLFIIFRVKVYTYRFSLHLNFTFKFIP